MRTAILYGSSLGNTQFIAHKIQQLLPHADCLSVSGLTADQVIGYDNYILGTSTWGMGSMQDDFELFAELLMSLDLSDKNFALFGLGDQHTYPDTFCDGMGKLYQLLHSKNWAVRGGTSTEDYDFSESEAVVDGAFVGLALDEDNEPDLSDMRIKNWLKQLNF